MSFLKLLLFTVCAVVSTEAAVTTTQKSTSVANSTEIGNQTIFVEHRLSKVKVTIQESFPADDCEKALENLKVLFTATNAELYRLTGLQIQTVNLHIPTSWAHTACHAMATASSEVMTPSEAETTASVSVVGQDPHGPVLPRAMHYAGCGEKGLAVQMPQEIILRNITREEENIFFNALVANEFGLFSNAALKTAGGQFVTNSTGQPLDGNSTTTSRLSGCTSGDDFCSTSDYNRDAPSKQNLLCSDRSWTEVISDLAGSGQPHVQLTPPNFRVVTGLRSRYLLLLDRSAAMLANNRWKTLQNALHRFTNEIPSGDEIGVVSMDLSVGVHLEPTVITDRNRAGIHGKIPGRVTAQAAVGCLSCGLKAINDLTAADRRNMVLVVTAADQRNHSMADIDRSFLRHGGSSLVYGFRYSDSRMSVTDLEDEIFIIDDVMDNVDSVAHLFTSIIGRNSDQSERLLAAQMPSEPSVTATSRPVKFFTEQKRMLADRQHKSVAGKFVVEDSLRQDLTVVAVSRTQEDVESFELTSPSGTKYRFPLVEKGLHTFQLTGSGMDRLSEAGVWSYSIRSSSGVFISHHPPASKDVLEQPHPNKELTEPANQTMNAVEQASSSSKLHKVRSTQEENVITDLTDRNLMFVTVTAYAVPSDTNGVAAEVWVKVPDGQTSTAQPPVIFARVAHGSWPVVNASVVARVYLPVVGGSSKQAESDSLPARRTDYIDIELKDDGVGYPDVEINDGIYSAYFMGIGEQPGHYIVQLTVSDRGGMGGKARIVNLPTDNFIDSIEDNTDNLDYYLPLASFTRYARTSFYLGWAAERFIRDGVPHVENRYPPGRITDLAVVRYFPHSLVVELAWTAPGADYYAAGTRAAGYDIRCYTNREALSDDSFSSSGIPVLNVLVPQPDEAGSGQTVNITLPWHNELFYYAVVAIDADGNRGRVSNLVPVHVTAVDDPLDSGMNPMSDSVTVRQAGSAAMSSQLILMKTDDATTTIIYVVSGCLTGLALIAVSLGAAFICRSRFAKRRLKEKGGFAIDRCHMATSENGGRGESTDSFDGGLKKNTSALFETLENGSNSISPLGVYPFDHQVEKSSHNSGRTLESQLYSQSEANPYLTSQPHPSPSEYSTDSVFLPPAQHQKDLSLCRSPVDPQLAHAYQNVGFETPLAAAGRSAAASGHVPRTVTLLSPVVNTSTAAIIGGSEQQPSSSSSSSSSDSTSSSSTATTVTTDTLPHDEQQHDLAGGYRGISDRIPAGDNHFAKPARSRDSRVWCHSPPISEDNVSYVTSSVAHCIKVHNSSNEHLLMSRSPVVEIAPGHPNRSQRHNSSRQYQYNRPAEQEHRSLNSSPNRSASNVGLTSSSSMAGHDLRDKRRRRESFV